MTSNPYFAIICWYCTATPLHDSLVYYQAIGNVIVLVVIAPASATGARARHLTNAPATFQKYVNWVLKKELDQEGVAYVNNILVTGHDQVTHGEKVQKILMKLYRAGLRAKLAKCRFKVPRVEFLGNVVGKEGVSTDPEKTQAVRD